MQEKKKTTLRPVLRTIILILALLCCALLLTYWLKSLLGWDLSPTHRLSDSFPFNAFQRSKLLEPQQEGVIINENFDSFTVENIWFLWTKKPGTVHFERNTEPGDQSKSLLFISDTDDEWSYVFTKFIKVNQNDIFRFHGFAKKYLDNNKISLRVAAFDATKVPLNWKYRDAAAKDTGQWFHLADEFIIRNPKIAYIKFQLAGKGKGQFRFDDIFFALELKGR